MKYVLIIFASFFLQFAFAQSKINNVKALENINTNKDIQILDVRTKKEFAEKHIPDAVNIDWKNQANFAASLSKLDKSRPVYVYCFSGGRSEQASKKLYELGFDVYDIEGGIMKWEQSNLPLIQAEQKKETKDELSLEDYNQIIKSNATVLVDFYAAWCAPCQELMPTINIIEEKYKNSLKVLKIDVDKNKDLIKGLGIDSMPTLFLYKNNKKIWSTSKVTSQQEIEKQINKK